MRWGVDTLWKFRLFIRCSIFIFILLIILCLVGDSFSLDGIKVNGISCHYRFEICWRTHDIARTSNNPAKSEPFESLSNPVEATLVAILVTRGSFAEASGLQGHHHLLVEEAASKRNFQFRRTHRGGSRITLLRTLPQIVLNNWPRSVSSLDNCPSPKVSCNVVSSTTTNYISPSLKDNIRHFSEPC